MEPTLHFVNKQQLDTFAEYSFPIMATTIIISAMLHLVSFHKEYYRRFKEITKQITILLIMRGIFPAWMEIVSVFIFFLAIFPIVSNTETPEFERIMNYHFTYALFLVPIVDFYLYYQIHQKQHSNTKLSHNRSISVNKLDIATWYGEHPTQVLIAYAIPTAVTWYYVFNPMNRQELTWIIVALSAGVYWYSTKSLRMFCYNTIQEMAENFSKSPTFSHPISENMTDRLDIEILLKLDELREEKGDYLKIIGKMDFTDSHNLFSRLARLKIFGYVHATPNRLSLTGLGIQVVDSEILPKSIVPPQFSTNLARSKIALQEKNYNKVVDDVSIFFEDVLVDSIKEELGDKFEEKWTELKNEGRVGKDLRRMALGDLFVLCTHLHIFDRESIEGFTLASFLKLRTPQKHSSLIDLDPEQTAKSAIDLSNVFVRQWFR